MKSPEIFDRVARRCARDRAAGCGAGADFLRDLMIDGLVERLDAVRREFRDILLLGCGDGAFPAPPGAHLARLDAGFRFARAAGGVQADEDRPPFADASFDLIVSAGVLDSVNDVPGALLLARRMLRPDGLLLAAFLGGNSLPTLRAAMRAADPDPASPHFHPLIDVRAAGDLLVRAGFALPVADREVIEVDYSSLAKLLDDLRGSAARNVLATRRALSRAVVERLSAEFQAAVGDNGRVGERFEIVFLTAWAPSPDQPQPARRGSATQSLRAALPGSTARE